MIKSMTGFGREHIVANGREIIVEIRSVNHRYYEFTSRTPRAYGYLDEKLKGFLKSGISRGKVEASVSIYNQEGTDAEIELNKAVAKGYLDALRGASDELDLDDAKQLVANGVKAVCEGANMPTTLEATQYFQNNGVWFICGKASNAGGVATSALEMSQNSERLSWTFEEVDAKLKNIMVNIYHNIDDAAKRYGMEGNYVAGANIAGFEKVVNAMLAQGVC